MSLRSQPLQPLNNGALNKATNLTPVKTLRRKEYDLYHNQNYQRGNQQQQHNIQAHVHHQVHHVPSNLEAHAHQQQEKPKKKKEKLSALCKTPPSIVRTRSGIDYRRGNFLGEGGFARCFQMRDALGKIYAAKTVAKALIKNEKTKTKLLLEIKIHKSL